MASDSLFVPGTAERDIRQEGLAQGLCGRLAVDGDRHGSLSTDLNPCRRSDRESGKALDARHALRKDTQFRLGDRRIVVVLWSRNLRLTA